MSYKLRKIAASMANNCFMAHSSCKSTRKQHYRTLKGGNLSKEIHNNQMEHQIAENKIRKSTLRCQILQVEGTYNKR